MQLDPKGSASSASTTPDSLCTLNKYLINEVPKNMAQTRRAIGYQEGKQTNKQTRDRLSGCYARTPRARAGWEQEAGYTLTTKTKGSRRVT